MNHQAIFNTRGQPDRRPGTLTTRQKLWRWRRQASAFLCFSVLALQFAIVWHDADHLWHDTHHDSAICAVVAANAMGGVTQCPELVPPGWTIIGSLMPPGVQSAAIAVTSPYYSRAPPQSAV
jgi:hypothetical protein